MFARSAIPSFIVMAVLAQPGTAQLADPIHGNSIGMAFVRIAQGTYLMGSPADDLNAAANEKPQHSVSLTKPFYLAKYEVTLAQWEAVMGASPFKLSRSNPFYGLPGMAQRLDKPTNPATVSWNDAQEFIKRLNRNEGHTRYRLPTEAEWEYAARAGTTTAYSFGQNASQLPRYAWFGEDFATGSTHPVGVKEPNAWGLHDVHGNVWEWVQDFYAATYSAQSAVDPAGPATGSFRVVRGGSWHETSGSWTSAVRKPYDADYRGISIGFRIAMTAVEKGE